jgi:hypothetical protein
LQTNFLKKLPDLSRLAKKLLRDKAGLQDIVLIYDAVQLLCVKIPKPGMVMEGNFVTHRPSPFLLIYQ